MKTIKVIITGATGMVGEGVLHECLKHESISNVLVVGRKTCGVKHPKLKEVLLSDFFNLSPIEDELKGYDACLFCLGTTSVGKKEKEFYHLTYELTMNFAQAVANKNSDLTFCYISGAGTNADGRMMWQKVKGKTENDLMKFGFKNVFNFRPAYIQPTKGMKNTLGAYKFISWMYPILKSLFPKSACTLQELGLAMIQVSLHGFEKNFVEVKDMVALSKR